VLSHTYVPGTTCETHCLAFVMAGPVPAIHVLRYRRRDMTSSQHSSKTDVDARDKRGHDGREAQAG